MATVIMPVRECDFQAVVLHFLSLRGAMYRVGLEGAQRTIRQAVAAKRLGMARGWPDVMIFEPRSPFCGLALELKVGRNKATSDQLRCMEALRDRGWRCVVIRPSDDWPNIIDTYLKGV
jgi:hypothetical protein